MINIIKYTYWYWYYKDLIETLINLSALKRPVLALFARSNYKLFSLLNRQNILFSNKKKHIKVRLNNYRLAISSCFFLYEVPQ